MILGSVDVIALAFNVFNFQRLASYFPQIVAVARDRQGATAISFSCWAIWVGANASTSLYAWAKLADVNLALISAFNSRPWSTLMVNQPLSPWWARGVR